MAQFKKANSASESEKKKKTTSAGAGFVKTGEGVKRQTMGTPLSRPVTTNTPKPGQAVNLSIPRGYFEAREAEKQATAQRNQSSNARWTSRDWEILAQSNQKAAERLAETAYTTNDDEQIAELKRLREQAAKYSQIADQKKAEEKQKSNAEKATEVASYSKNHDFETKAAEGAQMKGNVVQYVQDNWGKIAAGSPAKKGTKLTYRHLTDDEVKIYNYILAKKGEKEAQEYLDMMEDTLNQREGQSQFEHLKTLGDADYEIKKPQYGSDNKYLTDKEARTYEYLAANVSQEEADKYLESKQPELQQRRRNGEAFSPQIDKFGEKLATGVHGVMAGGDQWSQGVKQTFSNDLLTPTGTQYASGAVIEQLQKQGSQTAVKAPVLPEGAQYKDNKFVNFATQAVTPGDGSMTYQGAVTVGNMLPSILISTFVGGPAGMAGWADDIATAATTKATVDRFAKMAGTLGNAGAKLGSAAMFLGANGNAYNQARNEGYSEGQARLYGMLVGASEVAMQNLIGGITPLKMRTGNIEKWALGLDRGWKRALALLGTNVLSETIEEEVQLFVEPAFAAMITGKDYEVPAWEEILSTALITFLSTGALEGVSSVQKATSPEVVIEAAIKNYEKNLEKYNKETNSSVSPAASEEVQQADVASNAVAASNPEATVVNAATTILMEKQGLNLKTATARAEIIQKLVDGEKVDNKTINRLDPKNPTTQAIFTELTGVEFPENKGSIEVMYNTYRSAHEVAQQRVEENKVAAETASLNPETPVAAEPVMQEDLTPAEAVETAEAVEELDADGVPRRSFEQFKEELTAAHPELASAPDRVWKNLYSKYLGDAETVEFNGKRMTHAEFMSMDLKNDDGSLATTEQKQATWEEERTAQQRKALAREREQQQAKNKRNAEIAVEKWNNVLQHFDLRVEWDESMGYNEIGSQTGNVIALNPKRVTTAEMVSKIVAHEMLHGIKDEQTKLNMVNDIINVLHPSNVVLSTKIDEYIKLYSEHEGREVDARYAREEYAGDLLRKTFTDDTLLMRLANKQPDWIHRIVDTINRVADFFGVGERDAVDELSKRFANAVATNRKNLADKSYRKPGEVYGEDGKLVAVNNDQGYTRMSLSTYEMEGREYLTNWMDKAVDEGGLTREDADSIIESLDRIYDVCMEYKEQYGPFNAWSDAKVVTNANGDPVFSVVKPNGDYVMNLDFSLVCKKRRTLDAVLNELVKRGVADDLKMGQADFVRINNIIRKYGFETACDLCFVDAKRFRQAEVADNFVKMYNDLVKSLAPKDSNITYDYFNFGGNTLVENTGTGIDTFNDADLDFTTIDNIIETQAPESGAGSVEYRIAKHLKATAADRKLLMRGDFISTAGFDTVNVTNPAVLKLFNAKKGSAGPKSAVSDVQYLNEILRSSAFNRDKAYRVGGVRVQSFSDYVPRMVFDYLQMFADLSAKKMPAHTYTKEELFVKQFGLTGIKINMSLIPRVVNNGLAAGLDADGNYAWAKESFDYDMAVEIQNAEGYSRNCGTIAVGVSDEHIRKMMSEPEIRMIIPYHKSGLNPVVAKMNNIKAYTDYTGVQNTRRASTGKKLDPKVAADKKLLDAMPDFNTILFEAGEKGNPQAAVEEYVRWCEANDLLPKFDQFCYKQIDGVYVEENGQKVIDENYYKLIEDFTVYDNGQYVAQQDITMTFPTEDSAFGSMQDLIKRGLEEDAILEGDRTEKVPQIADEITKTLGKKTPRKRMALNMEAETDSAGFTLSEQQKEYFKNSKMVDNLGRLKLMFHGTRSFGFTTFDPEKSDDHRSLFFTDSIPVARTYTPSQETGLRLYNKDTDMSIYEEKDFDWNNVGEAREYLQKLGWEPVDGTLIPKKDLEEKALRYARQTAYEIRNWYEALEEQVQSNTYIYWLQSESPMSDAIASTLEAAREGNAKDAVWNLRRAIREAGYARKRLENLRGWAVDEDTYEGLDTMLEGVNDHKFINRHYVLSLLESDGVMEYDVPGLGVVPMTEEAMIGDANDENTKLRNGVYMVHLNLENPLIIDAGFHAWNDLDYDDVVRDAGIHPEIGVNDRQWFGDRTRDIAWWAEEHGYDGVIFQNLIDTGGQSELDNWDEDSAATVAIAFKSDQVKSAINKEPTHHPDPRYAIAGELANNPWQQATLDTAKQMKKDGKSKNLVRLTTGWWWGPDNKWRFEIDDSGAKLVRDTGSGTLGDFLDHPVLYKNYPGLEKIQVEVDIDPATQKRHGYFDGATNTLHINKKLKDENFKETLMHELQHLIQRVEGFERGSNLDVAYRDEFINAYKALKNTPQFKQLQTYESRVEAIENEILKKGKRTTSADEPAKRLYDAVHATYSDVVGENEARNTADRRDLSEIERQLQPPYMGDTGGSSANWVQEKSDYNKIHRLLGHNGVDKPYAPLYNEVRKNRFGPNDGGIELSYGYEDGFSGAVEGDGRRVDARDLSVGPRGLGQVNTTQASEESGASFMPETKRYALSEDVRLQYKQRYGTENPSDKTLMRHLERVEKQLADAEYERIAADTIAYLRAEDDKLAIQMYTKRKLRQQHQQHQRDQANTDARVAKEREAKKEALKTAKIISDAEKAVTNDAWRMFHTRKMREQHVGDVTKQKELARKRLKLKDEKIAEIREANKERSKLRRNAARTALRDKRRVDAKRAEIEKQQGLVDTIRKMPAQRSMTEKIQDEAQKLRTLGRTAYRNFVNVAAEIDRFSKRQISDTRAGDLVTLLGGSSTTVEQIFKTGLVSRTGDRVKVNGKELGSMKDVFLCMDKKGKVNENMQALLQDYMLHLHNQDRMSFVPKAEAALAKFEAEHPYIAGLNKETYAKLVAQTDAETAKLRNDAMVKAAREYAQLIRARDEAQNVPIFADKNGNAVTAETSKQRCEELLAQNPWLEEKAQGIYEWWDAFMRNWAVGDSISLEQYEAMRRKYPHYVPTYRQSEKGIGAPASVTSRSATPGKATQRATGSFREVVNIEDSFTKMVGKIVKLSRTNELYKNMLDTAMLDNDGTFEDMIVFNWDWQDGAYGRELEEGAFFNGDFDHHIDNNIGTEVNKTDGGYTLSAWYDGVKFSAYISEDLFTSIAGVTGNLDQGLEKLTQIGNTLTSPMKSMITGNNPIFGLRNVIRDLSTAMINTRVTNSMTGMAFYKYWAQAINEIRKGSDHWHNFVALGGTHSTYYNDSVNPSKALYKEKGLAGKMWETFGKFNEVTESATRFAEYLATVERLGDTYENRIKGIKNAAEVTVDFSRKGRYGKTINAWVPYWNPAVQGIDKQIRALVEAPEGSTIVKQVLKTGGRAMLNTVLLETIMQAILKYTDRDDEWEELDDRTKDAYYCIPLRDEHKFLKIPKSREWSAILGNPFWRLLEYANGRDNPFENYLETSIEASYIPPAIFRPTREGGFDTDIVLASIALDLARNEDFAGRTIVPSYLQSGSLDQQFDKDTSFFAKQLGDLINFSPMQIDYFIESYCGDFGQLFIEATSAATWTGDRTIGDTLYSIAISPWIKDNRYSNYATSAYYDRLGELDKVVQDKKNQLGTEEYKNTKEYQVQKALQELYGNDISDLNKMARELPDGPEKDAVKEELSRVIAEAIEYYDRAMAGQIDKPILDAEYRNCSDRVANELIRLDGYKTDYNFAPRDNAPSSYVDPYDSDYEYKFTDDQKDKYMDIYMDIYNDLISEEMSSSYYRNSSDEEKAGLLLDAKEEANDQAEEEFLEWIEKQGVRSTPRKGR